MWVAFENLIYALVDGCHLDFTHANHVMLLSKLLFDKMLSMCLLMLKWVQSQSYSHMFNIKMG